MRERRLTDYARRMRTEQSEPEIRVWLALRAKWFGNVKFRRQKVIGPYIVDFAAREPMLVIEVDGDTHAGRESYDAKRSAYLEEQGYRVLRFANSEVMGNMEGVLSILEDAVGTAPLPTLSPEGERAL